MDTQKTVNRIKQIKREVDELHPLLGNLFQKIPDISHVEYKQGAREAGADFVLVKSDPILEVEEYVGTVVKVGQIKSNDHTVAHQIDECINSTRTINGKKEILLDEVWVITSQNITQNAQDFLSKKYKNHKVKFIGAEKLGELVAHHLPEYYEDISIPLNHYILQTRTSIERMQASTQLAIPGMESVICEHDLILQDNHNYKNSGINSKHRQKVKIEGIFSKRGATLIEGAIGSGKTNLLRSAAIRLLETDSFVETKRLPVLISFSELVDNYNADLIDLIERELGNVKESGIQYVVMIDGIDESSHTVNDRVELIDSLISQSEAAQNIKLIMTSRLSNENALHTKFSKNLRVYHLAALSLKQIISIISSTCQNLNVKDRIIEDLKNSSLFKAIPKTPITAILLAKLLNENSEEIPSNLTELYSKYTEIALGRWDVKKGMFKEKEFEASEAITIRLAKYFFDNDLPAISVDEAKEFFRSYVENRKTCVVYDQLFAKVVGRGDIFYVDYSKSTFGFRHRTFIEFFYAKSLQLDRSYEISDRSFDMKWATVSFFWTGLLKDCPEVLNQFADVKIDDERGRLLKLINMGNILLAGSNTEYSAIQEIVRKVFIEAGVMYAGIIEDAKGSLFKNFSKMHLLAIFKYVMADGFGYQFFTDAIQESMISLSEDPSLTDMQKIYALFLMETSLVDPQLEDLFKSLIDPYAGKLPLDVTLAINHEAKASNTKNMYITKVFRDLKRLSKDHGFKASTGVLYEMPIKNLSVK